MSFPSGGQHLSSDCSLEEGHFVVFVGFLSCFVYIILVIVSCWLSVWLYYMLSVMLNFA